MSVFISIVINLNVILIFREYVVVKRVRRELELVRLKRVVLGVGDID